MSRAVRVTRDIKWEIGPRQPNGKWPAQEVRWTTRVLSEHDDLDEAFAAAEAAMREYYANLPKDPR